MQFNTQADRIAAIKKACEEMGTAYGELKFKEHMLVEVKQSFVPNTTATEQVSVVVTAPAPAPAPVKVEAPAPEPVEVKAPAVTPVKGRTARVKANDVPANTPKAEVVVKPEPAPVVDVQTELETNACPISSATELRQLMLTKFTDSGRNTDVQMALKAAIKEATGHDSVMSVTPEQLPAAYAAVMAVEV